MRTSAQWQKESILEKITHDLHEVTRTAQGREEPPTAVILDGRVMQSPPESDACAGYDGGKRKQGSTVQVAIDTLSVREPCRSHPPMSSNKLRFLTDAHPLKRRLVKLWKRLMSTMVCIDETAEDTPANQGVVLRGMMLPYAKNGFVLLRRHGMVAHVLPGWDNPADSPGTTIDWPRFLPGEHVEFGASLAMESKVSRSMAVEYHLIRDNAGRWSFDSKDETPFTHQN